jgi:hypothetical protein
MLNSSNNHLHHTSTPVMQQKGAHRHLLAHRQHRAPEDPSYAVNFHFSPTLVNRTTEDAHHRFITSGEPLNMSFLKSSSVLCTSLNPSSTPSVAGSAAPHAAICRDEQVTMNSSLGTIVYPIFFHSEQQQGPTKIAGLIDEHPTTPSTPHHRQAPPSR